MFGVVYVNSLDYPARSVKKDVAKKIIFAFFVAKNPGGGMNANEATLSRRVNERGFRQQRFTRVPKGTISLVAIGALLPRFMEKKQSGAELCFGLHIGRFACNARALHSHDASIGDSRCSAKLNTAEGRTRHNECLTQTIA